MYVIKLVSCIRMKCKTIRVPIYLFVICVHIPGTVHNIWENVPLTNFQPRIHMYPYHTETTAIISIKPIAIHTS